MSTTAQTTPAPTNSWWDSASSFVGGVTDTFTTLANGYFNFKAAENRADVTGQSQTQLSNTVEQQTTVGRQPLTSQQYQQVTQAQNANSSGGFASLDQKTLMIGAAALAALFLIKR